MGTMEVFTKDHFIGLQQGKIFVREWSPIADSLNSAIILIHDSLGCVDLWRDFPSKLCNKTDRRVFAYDRLGFGRSGGRFDKLSVNFIAEESEACLATIIDKFQLKSFIIYGHSVGGAMAVVCAGRFGELCKAVITESAQAFIEDVTLQGIIDAQKEFQNERQIDRLRKYHGAKAEWVLHAWTDTWLSPEFASWSLIDDLPKVTCPVMVIHGERDEFGSLRHPDMIADLAGGASEKYIIPNCGHIPHRDKPNKVLELVTNFVERL